jgi:hypothetical protein
MDWVDSFRKHWSSVVTIACIVVSALVSAWQQATSNVSSNTPIPRLGGIWHYVPLSLLIIAGVVWLIGHSHKVSPNQQQNQLAPTMSAVMPGIPTLSALQGQNPQVTFNAPEFFRLAYYSPVTAELENNIKIVANNYAPNDREAFYARFIGIGIVMTSHNFTWSNIYKSQLLLLAEMIRRGPMPVSDVKVYYDNAVLEYPSIYEHYLFE